MNIQRVNYQNQKQSFAAKISPDLIKKGNLSQALIEKVAKMGDSETVLKSIDPPTDVFDYPRMTFFHPALGKMSETPLPRAAYKSTGTPTIQDVFNALTDKDVKTVENVLLYKNYIMSKDKTRWNYQETIKAYEDVSKNISENLSPSSDLYIRNKAMAEKFITDEKTPITVITNEAKIKYPQESIH